MLFYRCEFEQKDVQAEVQDQNDRCAQRESKKADLQRYRMEQEARCEMKEQIVQKGELFSCALGGEAFFFIEAMKASKFSVIGILKTELIHTETPQVLAQRYVNETIGDCAFIKQTEITERELLSTLRRSEREDYILDEDIIIERFDLNNAIRRGRSAGEEVMLACGLALGSAMKKAKSLCCGESLLPEIRRIYDKTYDELLLGHPVQYFVSTSETALSKKAYMLLLESLYKNRRLVSRRSTIVSLSKDDDDELRLLFKKAHGGSIVFDITDNVESGEYASISEKNIKLACELVAQNPLVQTVFCLNAGTQRLKERIQELLPETVFVEISEDVITPKAARAYLKRKAAERGAKDISGLYDTLDKTTLPSIKQLNGVFERWYSGYLRTNVYPAYREICAPRLSKTPKGDAYSELSQMIGLAPAKETILSAVDYFKAQKAFGQQDASPGKPCMHMAFTGSPGTAKTTAARLFARIMYDNGLLSTGAFLEVSRNDLVGQYVGWTAQTVKQKFKSAKGGVLFIDEAYSLLDDRRGMFGDEAINTIVQEMENMRDEIVVIFAGYPDEMKEFLSRNPGLSSRIAFHVDFPDYSAYELLQISESIAAKNKRVLTDDAKAALLAQFAEAKKDTEFGNGRYARNLIEKAMMRQASRLLRQERAAVDHAALSTLTLEDFVFPPRSTAMRQAIGF